MPYTYAGHYSPEAFINSYGVPLRSQPVYVYERGTTNLATLYTDRTKMVTAPNPFLTDARGNGYFYADPDTYDLGVNNLILPDITVPVDPEEDFPTEAHTHPESEVVNLEVDLGNKSDVTHNHDADYDPSGSVATHAADTTSVHGIADTTVLATDAEVTSAISAHEAAGNPHAGYLTAAEGDAAYDALGTANAAVSIHAGLPDPHTGYQKESEKDVANGYAGLNASGLVPDARIDAAIARDSEVTTAVSNHAAAADPHTGYVLESLIDAKGDLIVGSAADTVGRLAPGTDTHVLTLDSAQALGVKWAAAAGGTTILQQANEPSSPVLNDLYIDTDEGAETGLSSILAYAEVTANQTLTADTDLTGLSVTVTVPAGRRIRISSQVVVNNLSGAAAWTVMTIMESAVGILDTVGSHAASGNNTFYTHQTSGVISPSAGAHTYYLRLAASAWNVQVLASSVRKAFILVEDITGTLWPAGQSIGAGQIASEAWTDYTPTNTNITVGNGTQVARYQRIGRTIFVSYHLTFGTTTSFGGTIQIGLPVNARALNDGCGHVAMFSAARGWVGSAMADLAVGNVRIVHTESGNFGFVDATNPFTWASTNQLLITFTYEAAA